MDPLEVPDPPSFVAFAHNKTNKKLFLLACLLFHIKRQRDTEPRSMEVDRSEGYERFQSIPFLKPYCVEVACSGINQSPQRNVLHHIELL